MHEWLRWLMGGAACAAVACGPGEQVERDFAALREELQAQRRVSDDLRARLERVESRVEFTARPAAAPRPAPVPEKSAPKAHALPDDLPTVRLTPTNSTSKAPPLDTRISLRDPTPEQLEDLERPIDLAGAVELSDPAAEAAFAAAVRRYNAGERLAAATEFEALAETYPRHAVTDNALYLAGMARVADGRCPDASPFFEKVIDTFRDTDAVGPSLLALAHCDAARGRKERATTLFERVVREFPRTPEATQAEAELAGSKPAQGR